MAERLSQQDYALLDELVTGPQMISGGKPRHGADRLVNAGYATSYSVNLSDVRYEITLQGKIARVLKSYGIWSIPTVIEAHRFDVDGLWRVKVACEGDPTLLLDIGAATRIVSHLRDAGGDDLASTFQRELERARRFGLAEVN